MAAETEGAVQGRQQDAFQRHLFADRLAQILSIRTGHESFVIGLQGPWGSGKTSLLNLVRESLTALEKAIVVSFNPWLYPNDESLLHSLIEALAQGIDANLVRRTERIGDALRKMSDVLLGFARAGAAVDDALKSGVDAADQSLKVGLDLLPTTPSSLDELKRRINAALRDEAMPVIVLVDDLDRLSSRQIQQLFRLIKLALDFDNVTFVLTYDPDHVARALGGEYGLGEEDGHQYLEKIVQLPLQLPKLDPPTFAEYVLGLLSQAVQDTGVELPAPDRERFQVTFERLMLPRLKTPRQAKRLANSIRFALPLMVGETNPGDVMLVETTRLLYPRTYQLLRDSPDVVLRPSQPSPWIELTASQARERVTALFASAEDGALELVGMLFPQVADVLSGMVFQAGTAEGRKRLFNARYFPRYFQGAVPAGDISDRVIDDVLDAATSRSPQAVSQMAELLHSRKAGLILRVLLEAVIPMPSERAKAMLDTLLEARRNLPLLEPEAWSDPEAVYTTLVFALLAQLPPSQRVGVMQATVASDDVPLTVVLNFLTLKVAQARDPLSETDRAQILRTAAERFRRQHATLADALQGDLIEALQLWAAVEGREATADFLDWLVENRTEAFRSIAARHVSTGSGPYGPHLVTDALGQKTYDYFSKIIYPSELALLYQRVFGNELDAIPGVLKKGGVLALEDSRRAAVGAYLFITGLSGEAVNLPGGLNTS